MLTIRVVIGLSLQGMQIGSSINPQVCRLNGLVRCSTLISAGNSNSLPPYSKFRWSSTSYSKFRQLPFCFIRTTLIFLFFSSIRRISSCTNFFRRFSFVVPHLGVVVIPNPCLLLRSCLWLLVFNSGLATSLLPLLSTSTPQGHNLSGRCHFIFCQCFSVKCNFFWTYVILKCIFTLNHILGC